MRFIKLKFCKNFELYFLFLVYFVLLVNFFVFKDSIPALLSAFFGITYTVFAGKGCDDDRTGGTPCSGRAVCQGAVQTGSADGDHYRDSPRRQNLERRF